MSGDFLNPQRRLKLIKATKKSNGIFSPPSKNPVQRNMLKQSSTNKKVTVSPIRNARASPREKII